MDMALLRRVAARGLSLDIAASIEDKHPLETAILGVMGIKGRGRPTFILRTDHADYAAQMRLEDGLARITLLAPAPDHEGNHYPWLALIDNMVRQAGRRGIQTITAEVPVDCACFDLFRHANFTVYSRDILYVQHTPERFDAALLNNDRLFVRPVEDGDDGRLNALYANTVPQLVQQVSPPPRTWEGLALLLDNRMMGCLAFWTGKHSLIIQPYLHPELYDLVPNVLAQALEMLPRLTVYVRLRAHQEWMRTVLERDFGFVEHGRYALMARHTVVRRSLAVSLPKVALEQIAFAPNAEIALEISSVEKPLNKKHNGISNH